MEIMPFNPKNFARSSQTRIFFYFINKRIKDQDENKNINEYNIMLKKKVE
jgi:hypothetical protein